VTQRSQIKAVSLKCPDCGNAMDGLDTDALFGCRDCAAVFEPAEGRLDRVPFQAVVVEPIGGAPFVHLPFWVFNVENGRTAIIVDAFDYRRRQYFGAPGLHLTQTKPALTLGPPPRLAGAVLRRKEAEDLARFHFLAMGDPSHHERIEDLSLVLLDARVVSIPFQRRDRHLVDPFSCAEYPVWAFPDLDRFTKAS